MFLVPWGSVVCQASLLPRGTTPWNQLEKMGPFLGAICWPIKHDSHVHNVDATIFEGNIYSIFLRKQETSSEIFSRSWGKFDLPSKMIWLVVQQIPNPKKAQKIRRNSNKNLPKENQHIFHNLNLFRQQKTTLEHLSKKRTVVYLSFLTVHVYHPFVLLRFFNNWDEKFGPPKQVTGDFTAKARLAAPPRSPWSEVPRSPGMSKLGFGYPTEPTLKWWPF